MKSCLMVMLLLTVAIASPVLAQSGGAPLPVEPEDDYDVPPAEPDLIVPIVNPTSPMTTKIAFIVDTSGSMDNGGRVEKAITFAQSIMGARTDELLVALLAFKDDYKRWPGVPHNGVGPAPPKGWTYFPGVPQLESAQKWLTAQGATGGTNPSGALREVLAEKIIDLTIVLITDGDDFDVDKFKKTIADGQRLREKQKLGKAVIFIVGTGSRAEKHKHLQDVGKSEGGGLFVIRKPELIVPEPIADPSAQLPDDD